MSYDVSLTINTGIEEVNVAECGNYTSNVSPMWSEALGFPLSKLCGMNASDAVPHLRKAIAAMEDEPNKYRAMNPENGWGNYEGALSYLRKMLIECVQHPLCKIYISC